MQEGADTESYNGLVMGANDNTYIMRGKHFDVLRNVSALTETLSAAHHQCDAQNVEKEW